MSIGDIGQWRHTAGSSPGTAWATLLLGAEDRNDSSNYSQSSGVITLPSGRFLLVYQVAWVASGANGRCNPEIAIRRNGSGQVPGSYGSGYQRDTANDAAWAAGSCIVESGGTDTIQVIHRRDTDSNVGSYDANRSFIDIVQLPDSTDYGSYSDTTNTAADDSTALTAVSLNNTVTESGTAISRSGSNITLAANTSYLITYGAAEYNSTGSRIARVSDLISGGSQIPGSGGFAYMRQTSDQYGCPNGAVVYETGGTSETLNIRVCRGLTISPGTAAAGGNKTAGTRGIQILALPSSAEWYSSSDNTGAQIVSNATTTIPMNLFRDEIKTDTGLITKTSNTEIELQKAADMLLFGSMYIRRTASSGTRLTREGTWSINGVEQSHGTNGNYNRGDQSSQDVYDSAHNPRGIFALSNGDDININMSQSWDTGWNDGGGNAQTNTAVTSGFFALNLDSLEAGGVTVDLSGSADSITNVSGAIEVSVQISGLAASTSALTGVAEAIRGLQGQIDSSSLTISEIELITGLIGSSDSVSDISGAIDIELEISGSSDTLSALSGDFDILGQKTYDECVEETNGGPTYRWKYNNTLAPDINTPSWTGTGAAYGPTIIAQDTGNCLDISAADLNLANQLDINNGTQTRKTLMWWIQPDTVSGNQGIYEQGGGTNWFNLYLVDDVLYWCVGTSNVQNGFVTVPGIEAGQPYHVVAEIDPATAELDLYVNGVKSTGTYTGANPFPSHTGDITLGNSGDARDHNSLTGQNGNFDGKVADFCYWANKSRLITQAEVTAIYEAGASLAIDLEGSLNSVSDLSASAMLTIGLDGDVDASSTLSGVLDYITLLDGNVATATDLQGNITVARSIKLDADNIESVSNLIGEISKANGLNGQTSTVSAVTAELERIAGLTGDIASSSDASGRLSIVVQYKCVKASIAEKQPALTITGKSGNISTIGKSPNVDFISKAPGLSVEYRAPGIEVINGCN